MSRIDTIHCGVYNDSEYFVPFQPKIIDSLNLIHESYVTEEFLDRQDKKSRYKELKLQKKFTEINNRRKEIAFERRPNPYLVKIINKQKQYKVK